jgi:phage gp36-like protein
MRARYQTGTTRILLDFDLPILQLNIPQTFYVNDALVGPITPGPSLDSLWIEGVESGPLGDLQLSYVAAVPTPLLYLAGPSTERLVNSFSIPVTIEQIASETGVLANTGLSPVLGDFIDAYGLEEAIVISNPDNALAKAPDEFKFLRAFEDAEALWNTYLLAVNSANKSVISAGKRRTILIFARYFLDSRCRRKSVTADYEAAIESMTKVNEALVEPSPTTGLYVSDGEIIYASQIWDDCHHCSC